MRTKIIALAFVVIALLSACQSTPTHVSYIPKDAAVVLGINTNELGKKIAWNTIWGSKLLDEMKKGGIDTGLFKDLSQSGIKGMSTYYVYMKPDKRYDNGNRLTAILPLDDAGKWETYLKKLLPQTVIKQQKDRKEAFLGNDVYAGWSDKVLIVMNVIYQPMPENALNDMDMNNMDSVANRVASSRKVDEGAMPAEMEKAFTTPKDNAITSIKHFTELEQKGHDITLWVNYEVLMGQYMSGDMTGGLALSGTLMKDAAIATGIDFEKGAIKGNMRYYTGPELSELFKEFAKDNADKDMIDRMPGNALALLAAWHLSPKAINMMLDKMGATGVANAAIADKNMTVEYVLDAFGGDMVVALNNFSMQARTIRADSLFPGQQEMHTTNSDIDYTYALKIGKKENFDRILQMAVSENMLAKESDNHYKLAMGSNPVYLVVGDKEMVITDKLDNADAYLAGAYKSQSKGEAEKAVKGYPFGLYFDVKAMTAGVDPTVASTPADANKLVLSKTLLIDVSFRGGAFTNDAFEYNLSVNFINKDENSLLILMDYANKMAKTNEEQQVAIQ